MTTTNNHKIIVRAGCLLNKKSLSDNQKQKIIRDLTVTPIAHPDYDMDSEPFTVYKENDDTFCVPKYYAKKYFGNDLKDFTTPTEININFKCNLREYQIPMVKECIKIIKSDGGGVISVPCAFGKCLEKGTKIIMYDGSIKKVEDIKIGDKLMGDDGCHRNVLSLARGIEKMYNIKEITDSECGGNYTVNESHILSLRDLNNNVYDVPLKEYLNSNRELYGYRIPIKFNNNDISKNILDKIKEGNNIKIHDYNETEIEKIIFRARSNGLYVYKKNNILTFSKASGSYKIEIKELLSDEYFGFEIDGNKRFLLGDFTVTHNTTTTLYMIAEMKVKALVLVHKSFLLDQWVERIQQFTDAKIGIIRQKKIDVKGKDIVVGMLQSISMIDYDQSIFDDFGFVICDECHHFGSRVFSRAFNKVTSKYTLGLSATPIRSDGLTKVFLWNLGDFMYRAIRRADKNVVVKIFNYESNDPLFVEKKKWMGGQMKPCEPIMTTNLYKIHHRNTFCINIINSLRKQLDRKILVLSGRLEHLRIMKEGLDVILKRDIDEGTLEYDEITTAYYVGGMKESQRNNSSTADIIFATYSMAAEGLDIDKLNTLVLSTPKRNIIQSIGRIMRKPIKEGSIKPLVVDIADSFSVYENWTYGRRSYYEKQKYTIHFYKAFNDKCIDIKEFLIRKSVIDRNNVDNIDVREKYIKYMYGDAHYELEKDTEFENDYEGKYNYNPDLDKLFNVSNDIEEMTGDDFIIQSDVLNIM